MRYDFRHVATRQTERSPMKKLLTVLMVVSAFVAPVVLCAANKPKPSSSPIYVITNDDALRHTYASFYLAGGTQGAPTLTYVQSLLITNGLGIGGGFRDTATGDAAIQFRTMPVCVRCRFQ